MRITCDFSPPALVQALAMAELLFAQMVTRRIFEGHTLIAERAGASALVLGDVGILLL